MKRLGFHAQILDSCTLISTWVRRQVLVPRPVFPDLPIVLGDRTLSGGTFAVMGRELAMHDPLDACV